MKPTTIRLVLSIVFSKAWKIKQLDVNNTFLHGFLHANVYMLQPPGFQDAQNPIHVCKLHRSLYGLKHAPRAWFHRLSTFLTQHGLIASKNDSSLFIYTTAQVTIYILIYVDDILVTGGNFEHISTLIGQLANEFSLKDLGNIHYFLGIDDP